MAHVDSILEVKEKELNCVFLLSSNLYYNPYSYYNSDWNRYFLINLKVITIIIKLKLVLLSFLEYYYGNSIWLEHVTLSSLLPRVISSRIAYYLTGVVMNDKITGFCYCP